jgi:hypothetical protein
MDAAHSPTCQTRMDSPSGLRQSGGSFDQFIVHAGHYRTTEKTYAFQKHIELQVLLSGERCLIHTEIYNLAESYPSRFRIIALLTDGLAVTQGFVSYGVVL